MPNFILKAVFLKNAHILLQDISVYSFYVITPEVINFLTRICMVEKGCCIDYEKWQIMETLELLFFLSKLWIILPHLKQLTNHPYSNDTLYNITDNKLNELNVLAMIQLYSITKKRLKFHCINYMMRQYWSCAYRGCSIFVHLSCTVIIVKNHHRTYFEIVLTRFTNDVHKFILWKK